MLAFLNEKVSSKVGTPPKPEHFDSEKSKHGPRTHIHQITSLVSYPVRNLRVCDCNHPAHPPKPATSASTRATLQARCRRCQAPRPSDWPRTAAQRAAQQTPEATVVLGQGWRSPRPPPPPQTQWATGKRDTRRASLLWARRERHPDTSRCSMQSQNLEMRRRATSPRAGHSQVRRIVTCRIGGQEVSTLESARWRASQVSMRRPR